MLEWERDLGKKRENERKKICQEDQMLELTFNFHGALSILTFSKNELTFFHQEKQKKSKRKKIKKKRK